MMKILVSDPISEEAIRVLKQARGVEVTYDPDTPSAALLQTVNQYDALIVRSRTKVTKEVIEAATKLKVIGRAGVGIDNIDGKIASEKKIKIINTPDALTNAVAEFTIGLMVDLSRQISKADASMRRGEWAKSSFHGVELKGRTYGTIGIGRIGQRVVEIAHSFGMKILANDIVPIPQQFLDKYEVEMTSQEQVFSRSDYVDLHVPLTPQTVHMINYDRLSKMKRSAYLINTSRGKVIDEDALIRALNEGLIAGAALDVFEIEPPKSQELLKNSRIILTPHIAGQTEEAQAKAGLQVVEEVLKCLGQ
ncbi:MAG TPA: hydroxyacid dehydrogenase [Nitrososphaerales archaeon]|nr:hydroxyacid dehydrogenase [Nitrososphaerales archaeon]